MIIIKKKLNHYKNWKRNLHDYGLNVNDVKVQDSKMFFVQSKIRIFKTISCRTQTFAKKNSILLFSRDCSIFYMRRKVQKDLADQNRIITRFSVAPLNW